ncbi:MAG: DNA mismatch repair endonuclease MutL [Clostridia bacterium]|nr:DNA mismatch repair endonuclease MutL [Clostridia bacterium]
MGKINKLPKNIWELIAAGEVVERPASVVKELLENSIDAGATAITLEIQSGGIRYIRITDNGCGIQREDVPLAFLSHATSKISTASDLDAIGTLGFRGEALASVAAVSKVEIMTKTAEEQLGTRMVIHGGETVSLDDAGCPNGTTIIIRELFYNTPARMKFLKSDKSEGMAVAGIVDKIAISHPEISLRFIKDGKEVICTNGSGSVKDAVFAVYGRDFADTLINADYEINGVKVEGFISKPFNSRGSGSMQLFFVNDRFIKSKTAAAALNEAYKNSIMVGRYPACVLFLKLSPELVDVNVHPAKTEVRFSNEKAIFDAVYYAAKNALSNDNSRPQVKLESGAVKTNTNLNSNILSAPVPEAQQRSFSDYTLPEREKILDSFNNPFVNKESESAKSTRYTFNEPKSEYSNKDDEIDLSVKTGELKTPAESQPVQPITLKNEENRKEEVSFKYLGEAFKTYIFAEYNGKLVIIDKHAAHERMLFNKLKKNLKNEGSQLLLKPVSVVLSKDEYIAVTENLEIMKNAGFEIDDFGNGTVLVRSCPLDLEKEDITELVSEVASYLASNKKDVLPEKLDWIYHNISCRAAIKAGNIQTDYELIEFTKQLLADDEVRYCPHGRPVLIELTKYELDKQFGRIQ